MDGLLKYLGGSIPIGNLEMSCQLSVRYLGPMFCVCEDFSCQRNRTILDRQRTAERKKKGKKRHCNSYKFVAHIKQGIRCFEKLEIKNNYYVSPNV